MSTPPDTNAPATADIRIRETEILAKGHGTLRRTTFDHRRRDGTWQTVTRESYDHGNGAAILLIDPVRHTVLLTRQFRYPAHQIGHTEPLIEVVAGLLDDDTDPATTASREAEEEAGCHITDLHHALDLFTSPGVVAERITCFTATYDPSSRIHDGGGLPHEGEDIEVLELPIDEAVAMIEQGKIVDSKTIALLYYAKLHDLA